MFKLVLIASVVALAVAQYGHGLGGYGGGHGGYGGGQGGYGGGHDDLAQPTPFRYGYDIHGGDAHTGDFRQTRQEHGDGHGNVQGSYSYQDAHGNHRQVDYVADGHGFRAQVRTNEPGTESQSPADVHLESSAHGQGGYGGHGLAGGYGVGGGVGGGHGLY